jgi:hypothetical protein
MRGKEGESITLSRFSLFVNIIVIPIGLSAYNGGAKKLKI